MKSAFCQGKLIKWKDDRGFGFIRSDGESKEIFLHISALAGASRRPKVGDVIFYEEVIGKDGKLSAANASIQGVASRSVNKDQLQHRSTKTKSKSTLQIFSSVFGLVAFGVLAISSNRSSFNNATPQKLANPTAAKSSVDTGCNIKGNISVSSGDKFYHLQGMPEYEITQIDISKGERYFCSESEAIASGWRKAPR